MKSDVCIKCGVSLEQGCVLDNNNDKVCFKCGAKYFKEALTNFYGKEELIVCASGYWNPLHFGHLQYLRKAKALGSKLIVIVNNDNQVKVKGSVPFMNEQDRMELIKELKCVDEVFLSIDQDGTVCKSLEEVKPDIFAKGGDRTLDNIPEKDVCEKLGISMTFGLGEKIRASSTLIKNWEKNKKDAN